MPDHDVVITPNVNANQYTISFDTDGGSGILPITQDYGSAVTAPANPTKTGYTFAGWDKAIPATMPNQNITIKAKWTINQYTITFDTDGGSEIQPIKQNYNTAVTEPADPTKTGYDFDEWDRSIPQTMPAENITIKAKWATHKYTVSFDTDDGSEVAAVMQDYGKTITAPDAPQKAGSIFGGWYKEKACTNAFDFKIISIFIHVTENARSHALKQLLL